MPYDSIADLPEGQTDQYSRHQKHAFLKAFNSALDEYKDESRAFAVAHAAAQRAPRDEPDEDKDHSLRGRTDPYRFGSAPRGSRMGHLGRVGSE